MYEYLEEEGLRVVSEDVGDIYPRKVNFYPETGRVRMKKLHNKHNDTIKQREERYRKSIDDAPVESEIELF